MKRSFSKLRPNNNNDEQQQQTVPVWLRSISGLYAGFMDNEDDGGGNEANTFRLSRSMHVICRSPKSRDLAALYRTLSFFAVRFEDVPLHLVDSWPTFATPEERTALLEQHGAYRAELGETSWVESAYQRDDLRILRARTVAVVDNDWPADARVNFIRYCARHGSPTIFAFVRDLLEHWPELVAIAAKHKFLQRALAWGQVDLFRDSCKAWGISIDCLELWASSVQFGLLETRNVAALRLAVEVGGWTLAAMFRATDSLAMVGWAVFYWYARRGCLDCIDYLIHLYDDDTDTANTTTATTAKTRKKQQLRNQLLVGAFCCVFERATDTVLATFVQTWQSELPRTEEMQARLLRIAVQLGDERKLQWIKDWCGELPNWNAMDEDAKEKKKETSAMIVVHAVVGKRNRRRSGRRGRPGVRLLLQQSATSTQTRA